MSWFWDLCEDLGERRRDLIYAAFLMAICAVSVVVGGVGLFFLGRLLGL